MALILNLRGPAGNDGAAGPQGATGAQGQQGNAGAQGPQGATGAAGANGATWLTGSGVPSDGIGNNNDLYLRTDTGDVYKKVGGTWV